MTNSLRFWSGQSTTDNTFTKFERLKIVCYDFSKMVIVKNTGGVDLKITGITLTGDNAAEVFQ